jgi:CubicO group peptidase (beta-lactamase class C family)
MVPRSSPEPGTVVLELAAGPADVETGAGCTPQARFQREIVPVSRQFVAAAVMLLAEPGTAALGEPVDLWLRRLRLAMAAGHAPPPAEHPHFRDSVIGATPPVSIRPSR